MVELTRLSRILPKDDAAYDYDHKYTLGAT